MPIRFRCVYCDKLLGIGRRKAGAVVDCPHCGEKLIVPTPEAEHTTAAPPESVEHQREIEQENALAAAGGGPQLFERAEFDLFERSDFEDLLQPGRALPTAGNRPPLAAPKPNRAKTELPAPLVPQPKTAGPNMLPEYMPLPPALPASEPIKSLPGIYISPSKATWLSVLAVLLLSAAFAGGFLVGRIFRAS